jgi:23S rRNA (pseudouridine1915-N3)-methyltransferase
VGQSDFISLSGRSFRPDELRNRNANGMAEEFIKRSTRCANCEMREIHPGRFDPWERHPSALKIALDPAGKLVSTKDFVALVDRAEQEARDLVFLIGGHDGLPDGWAAKADRKISLSPMTFPHELARAMLAEQIYRAFTALRGHPYPR